MSTATQEAAVARLSRVVPNSPAAVLLVDLDAGRVTYANAMARELAPGLELPAPVELWSRAAGLRDPHGSELDDTDGPLAAVAGGTPVMGEAVTAARASAATTEREPLWVIGLPLTDATGPLARQALVVFLRLRDESAVHDAQVEAADFATRAVVATGTAFTVSDATDPDMPLVWVNPAFEAITGYQTEQAVGRNCRFLQGPLTDRAAVQRIRTGLDARQPVDEVLLNYRADGTVFWNALTITPLFDVHGRVTHFVGVQSDVTLRVQAEEERAAAHALADQALTAERLARADAEEARELAEAAQLRLGLLAEASGMLAATLDAAVAAERLCRLVVPVLADWTVLTLVGEGGIESVLTHHRDGHEELLERWRQLHPALLRGGTRTAAVLASQQPVLLSDITPAALRSAAVGESGGELAELAAELGQVSVMVVPLVARRQVLGTLSLVSGSSGRRYTAEDLSVATDLARRAALALDNARLYTAEHRRAVELQRSLLPSIPAVPGIDAAALYLPSAEQAEVGGDWYDVLALPDGATGLAIGDVMGHDLAAAAAMGQLRSVLRSYAWEGDPPGRALDRLDRLVQGLGMADLATCVYARLEGAAGEPRTLTWSNAGHHPPLLRRPDGGVVTLDGGNSVVIGVDVGQAAAAVRAEAECTIEPGSVLLLFTDGLVEGRRRDLDEGLADVASCLAAHDPGEGPAALTHQLAETLLERGQDDDVCLLAVHVL